MPIGADLYPRHALATVSAVLQDTRVVVINGARKTGKSTLARLVAADHTIVDLRFLDDAGTARPPPRIPPPSSDIRG